ncbi:MAG: ATPase [Ktedonobacterales bacterium]|nr:ATPase [Ktedonobacterales bacterium]
MLYMVGVDGGGTKTTATIVGPDLAIVGSATTGPANPRSVGIEAASANIAAAVTSALGGAGLALDQIDAIGLCLAGFDTDLDLPVPRRAVALLGYAGAVIFENDAVGAWAGATEAQPGIVVIAGTGATALGMNARGEFWRTDGWDYLLGDAGSGYAIGLAGIRAALKTLDGRAGPTRLVRALGDAYGVTDAEEMRRLWDSLRLGKLEIAAFAQHVAAAAAAGDLPAHSILTRAGRDLGESVAAIVRQLGMAREAFPICAVGGVFASGPWVTDPFRVAITQAAPSATLRPPLHPPEVGAAILVRRRLEDGDTGSWTLGLGRRHIRRTLRVDEAT